MSLTAQLKYATIASRVIIMYISIGCVRCGTRNKTHYTNLLLHNGMASVKFIIQLNE